MCKELTSTVKVLGMSRKFLRFPEKRDHHMSNQRIFLDCGSVLSEYRYIPFNSKAGPRTYGFMN